MTNTTKQASEIVPGDIISFLGNCHRIARIDPPTATTLSILPECLGYAVAADGWSITLTHPTQGLEVV